jgi:hypothetical protein
MSIRIAIPNEASLDNCAIKIINVPRYRKKILIGNCGNHRDRENARIQVGRLLVLL